MAERPLAGFRSRVHVLLEAQRHSRAEEPAGQLEDAPPSRKKDEHAVDVHSALEYSFQVLLRFPQESLSSDHVLDTTDAFQILCMVVQLNDFALSRDIQKQLAQVVHSLWSSTSPGVLCRNLLEGILTHRKSQDSAFFLESLLDLVRESFSVVNKRSLQILSYIFDAVTGNEPALPSTVLDATFPNLATRLAEAISSQAGATQAARILAKLAIHRHSNDIHASFAFLEPLVVQTSHIGKQAVLENFLPPILEASPALQRPLLDWAQSQSQKSADHLSTFLGLARLCVSLAPQTASTSADNAQSQLEAFESIITDCLIHVDPAIRLEAFHLLTGLPAGTASGRRFLLRHLDLHRTFWKYSLTDFGSAAVRTGLIGVWKEFINRARLSSNAAQKVATKARKGDASKQSDVEALEAQEYVDVVFSFFQYWVSHAVDQLQPVKPYRCQFSALLFLQFLLEQDADARYIPKDTGISAPKSSSKGPGNGKGKGKSKSGKPKEPVVWPFDVNIVTPELVEKLISCMMSTYEDIRTTAFAILAQITTVSPEHMSLIEDLGYFLVERKRDSDISSATLYLRLHHILTLARGKVGEELAPTGLNSTRDLVTKSIFRLLDMLESRILLFKDSLADAADKAPVHGLFQAIATLLDHVETDGHSRDTFAKIRRRCLAAIYAMWDIARPTVCQDTELGGDADDEPLVDAAEQNIYNACWRAIKEAGYLLSKLLSLSAGPRQCALSLEELTQHAELFATWLLDIGHRGVFSHVSQAYTSLCYELLQSTSEYANLPALWLRSHLHSIIDVEQVARRRSAGLPYLLLGILTSFPPGAQAVRSAFGRMFASLDDQAHTSNATRTHVLHCLRVLLHDGKMTQSTRLHVEEAFCAAVAGFGDPDWDVRNASLMLYTTLIQRTFGVRRESRSLQSRRTSTVDFFTQYPNLDGPLVVALERGVERTTSESLGSVFAILLLLSLLSTPSASPEGQKISKKFLHLVEACCISTVWKVREAGAAALTGLIPEDQAHKRSMVAMQWAMEAKSSNMVHGWLLQAHALLASTQSSPQHPDEFWPHAHKLLQSFLTTHERRPIVTVALNIMSMTPLTPQGQSLQSIRNYAMAVFTCESQTKQQPGEMSYQRALAETVLRSPVDASTCAVVLRYGQYVAQEVALGRILESGTESWDLLLALSESILAILASPGNVASVYIQTALALVKLQTVRAYTPEDQRIISQAYRSINVPAVTQALFPLLCIGGIQNIASDDLLEGFKVLTVDESPAARASACSALTFMADSQVVAREALHYDLVQFLQDDDEDVRDTACNAARTLHGHQFTRCINQALETSWIACRGDTARPRMHQLLQTIGDRLEKSLSDLQASHGLLFAVERPNMYIDITVDLSELRLLVNQQEQRSSSDKSPALVERLRGLYNAFDVWRGSHFLQLDGQAARHHAKCSYTYAEAEHLAAIVQQVII